MHDDLSDHEIERTVDEQQRNQRRETEAFLQSLVADKFSERRDRYWDRDYGSVERYRESVRDNREHWQEILGEFESGSDDFDAERRSFLEDEDVVVDRLSIELFDGADLRGRALLGRPVDRAGPIPLVICQHGYGSSPERVFGLMDEGNMYHSFAYRLAAAGYAVLAPLNITEGNPRNRFERLTRLVDKSLFGLEVFRTSRFIDYFEQQPEIDDSRIAMWGLSMGGNYTLFTVPAEDRIDVGICSAFFNDRIPKMVYDDARFSAFISPEQYEHMYLPGWLTAFSDSDLVSLICPRPFMIQTGESDGIGWPPSIRKEFDESLEHYERLDAGDRLELCAHDGGHEIVFDAGLEFLRQYL